MVLRWSLRLWHVWSAKRIYFTPAEKLSVIMMSTKRQLVMKLMKEEDLLLTPAQVQLQMMKTQRCKRKKMRDWQWLQHRVLYGQYEKLVAGLREEDARAYYKNYMTISLELFQKLLERVWHLYDQFQTMDHIRICYGYAAVASSASLPVSTVIYRTDTCGRLRKKWNCWTCWKSRHGKPRRRKHDGSSPTIMSTDPERISHGD